MGFEQAQALICAGASGGLSVNVVTDELLRSATFDPHVRKRRVVGYRAGLRIDAHDLQSALTERMPERPPGGTEVDAAIRRHGGDCSSFALKRSIGWLVTTLTRGSIAIGRPEYWLEMHAWQRLRQQRPARRTGDL